MQQSRRYTLFANIPYWLLVLFLSGIVFFWYIIRSETLFTIFTVTLGGLGTTLYVSVVSYAAAAILGLLIALLRVSHLRVLREISSLYIEVIRGIPMLVILYYIAFVALPGLVMLINWMGAGLQGWGLELPTLHIRDFTFTGRAIVALTIGYSAFIAEIFRAGIESVDYGQIEAAYALGMSRTSAFVYIIMPQAIRNVLPPLGNEFIAIIKDSALVSVLGVRDITLIGRIYSSSSFRFFETYNIVAFLYLSITITLSLALRLLERVLAGHKDRGVSKDVHVPNIQM